MAAAPTPEGWIRNFVGLFLEVEACLRPVRHLRPMMAPHLEPTPRPAPPSHLPGIGAIRLQVRRGACEAVVLLHHPGRVEALALALRRDAQGWRVDEVRRPGQPLAAPPPGEPDTAGRPARSSWAERVDRTPRPEWVMPDGWQRPAAA